MGEGWQPNGTHFGKLTTKWWQHLAARVSTVGLVATQNESPGWGDSKFLNVFSTLHLLPPHPGLDHLISFPFLGLTPEAKCPVSSPIRGCCVPLDWQPSLRVFDLRSQIFVPAEPQVTATSDSQAILPPIFFRPGRRECTAIIRAEGST